MRVVTLIAGAAAALGVAGAAAAAGAPQGSLSAYAGKYPTFEEVNGVVFLAQPSVVAAVKKAIADKTIQTWVLSQDTTTLPITLNKGKLLAHACEPHNCGDHEWTIVMDVQTGAADVCYHDIKTMKATEARWYLANGTNALRPGDCPVQ